MSNTLILTTIISIGIFYGLIMDNSKIKIQQFVSLFFIITMISFYRCPDALLYPILYGEDGTQALAFYYNNPQPSSIWRYYSGYISLSKNLIGYLVTKAPIGFSPYLLSLISLLISAVSFSLFYSSAFKHIISSNRIRFIVCISIAAIPLGNHVLITCSDYSIWNLKLILILLTLSPFPKKRLWMALRLCLMTFLIFSPPSSFILIPVYVINMFREPFKPFSKCYLYLILVTIIYLCFGIRSTDGPVTTPFIPTVHTTLRLLTDRVIFETFFGNEGSIFLFYKGLEPLVPAISAGIIIFISAVALKLHTTQKYNPCNLTIFCYIILVMTLLPLLRYGTEHFDGSWLIWAHRYFYIQKIMFILLISHLISIYTLKKRIHERHLIICFSFFILYVSLLNYYNNHVYYKTSKEEGKRVEKFIKNVSAQEKMHGGRNNIHMKLDRGRWSIILDKK